MSTLAPGKDVQVEGRFVLLELGPNEQTKSSKKDFYVGIWRWYCRCSSLLLTKFLCRRQYSHRWYGYAPYKNNLQNLYPTENPIFNCLVLLFLIVPSQLCRQLSVLRSKRQTLVTLSPLLNLDQVVASFSLKLTYFHQSRPLVIHNLQGNFFFLCKLRPWPCHAEAFLFYTEEVMKYKSEMQTILASCMVWFTSIRVFLRTHAYLHNIVG